MVSALKPDGRLGLIIFDCDGVLIDSEGTSCRIIAQSAREAGLSISDEEAVGRFGGKALMSLKKEIEAQSGQSLPENWCTTMRDRFVESFRVSVDTIDGTLQMLRDVQALRIPMRVGSNSSMLEMDAKFDGSGLFDFIPRERIHSATDMQKPKPSPAVYLHAAAEEGVPPDECVVLEDSDTGAKAALEAGMTCVLLRDKAEPAPDWPGLIRVSTLAEFSALLRRTLQSQSKQAS